eukprot:9351417-Pyramimonas_sp.AAC.1
MIRRVRLLNPEAELGLLAELGSQTYRIIRVIVADALGFSYLTRSVGQPQSSLSQKSIENYEARSSVRSIALKPPCCPS